ncbi:hypothetical protein ATHL_01995 [Anaerolinea thermolimosa]|uniref:hypothetical protein n=1 Tax=Anaerolinea thermolimosa TaxID=229919 RepID=UPI0007807274|nr:hypothetical protein [Anaerolinea thermolimosa]GAP07127.1 hypothetical protein ATHL_01995 [Anaerolinea thermolimosa]
MKEEFSSRLRRKSKKVQVQGFEVEIRELSGGDYLEITEKSMQGQGVNYKDFLNLALLKSVFVNGEPLFEGEADLQEIPASVYSELVTEITQINGLENPKKS